jgi:hypothetical protein
MTASITGAGLVIAYYAFVAAMADRIFQRRADKLEERHKKILEIRKIDEAFEPANLEKTTKAFQALTEDVKEIGSVPSYLGYAVFVDFALFSFSALAALNWLSVDAPLRNNNQWLLVGLLFLAAIAVLMFVGGSGIVEVYRTMQDRFEKLKQQKNDVQRDADLSQPSQ